MADAVIDDEATKSKDMLLLFPEGAGLPNQLEVMQVYHPRQDETAVMSHQGSFYELQSYKLSKFSSWSKSQRVSNSKSLNFRNETGPRSLLLPSLDAAPANFSPFGLTRIFAREHVLCRSAWA